MMRVYKKNTLFGCFLIIYVSIIAKALQYIVLPPKYFYDSKAILFYMNGNYIADKSYNFTAKIFDTINIFKFDELIEWSIFLSIIFTVIFFFYLIKNNEYNLKQYIFIYSSMILLNIYVFNLSKDIIQFCFFLIIYIVILNKNLKNKTKLLLITLVLLYESMNFRVYYLIMALLIITIYFIYMIWFKNKCINKNLILRLITLVLISFFIQIFIVKLVSPESYNSICNARSSVNMYRIGSTDAATMIQDVLGENTNYIKFMGNYMINIFRIMFPMELLMKGVKYIPFIIYQLFISLNIISLSKKLKENNIIIFAVTVSFMMVSIIFEPDFGSFIRHESALMLLLLEMNIINENSKKISKCIRE